MNLGSFIRPFFISFDMKFVRDVIMFLKSNNSNGSSKQMFEFMQKNRQN